MLLAAAVTASVLAAGSGYPLANFSAEAQVVSVRVPPPGEDLVVWLEVRFLVTRCIAGACVPRQAMTMKLPAVGWLGETGQTMGLVGYGWQGKKGEARSWNVALSLKDDDQKDRFNRESQVAVAGSETNVSGTAEEMMKEAVPEPVAER